MPNMKNPNAVSLGSLGGRAKSEKKTEAARENGKKGGRPFMRYCEVCGVSKKFTRDTWRRENEDAYCYCTPATPHMFGFHPSETKKYESIFKKNTPA